MVQSVITAAIPTAASTGTSTVPMTPHVAFVHEPLDRLEQLIAGSDLPNLVIE
jgi:hypothetical protein